MANYQLLKADIDAKVYENAQQKITGENLNSVLKAMVATLGAEYQFAGVATTATNPGTPDAKVFYIAKGKGTYTHFGGLQVTEDDVVVLYWDSSWHKEATGIASNEKLTELESKTDDLTSEIDGGYKYVTIEGKLDTSGSVVEDKNYFTSDFIQAVGGQSYTHHNNTSEVVRFACYDDNKIFIDSWGVKTSRLITLPSNAKYIRASFTYPKDADCFVLKGTSEKIFDASAQTYSIKEKLAQETERAISRENDIENGIQPKIDATVDATLIGKSIQVVPIFESGAYNQDGSINPITWANRTERLDISKVKSITLDGTYLGAPSLYTILYKDNVVVRAINENQFLNHTPYVIDTTNYDEVAFSFHSGSSPIVYFAYEGLNDEIESIKGMFGEFAPRVIPTDFTYPISKDIIIYKNSIVLNDNEQGITNGKSQYRDRIVIGESSVKKVQYGYFVFDKDNAKVRELPFSVDYKSPNNKSMKILLLGDSTIDTLVNGVPVESGRIVHYLKALYPNITLIGDRGAAPYVHSGHGGWRAADYAYKPYRGTDTSDINPFFNPETSTFDFGYYISTKNLQLPDVVIIQLGINDVSASSSPDYGDKNISSYISAMKMIISSIHNYNANIKVYVHLIFPPSSSWEHHEAYHDSSLSPNIMKRYNILANAKAIKELNGVSVMPTNAILNADTDFADRVHPNSGGYEKVAKFIADYLSVL